MAGKLFRDALTEAVNSLPREIQGGRVINPLAGDSSAAKDAFINSRVKDFEKMMNMHPDQANIRTMAIHPKLASEAGGEALGKYAAFPSPIGRMLGDVHLSSERVLDPDNPAWVGTMAHEMGTAGGHAGVHQKARAPFDEATNFDMSREVMVPGGQITPGRRRMHEQSAIANQIAVLNKMGIPIDENTLMNQLEQGTSGQQIDWARAQLLKLLATGGTMGAASQINPNMTTEDN